MENTEQNPQGNLKIVEPLKPKQDKIKTIQLINIYTQKKYLGFLCCMCKIPTIAKYWSEETKEPLCKDCNINNNTIRSTKNLPPCFNEIVMKEIKEDLI